MKTRYVILTLLISLGICFLIESAIIVTMICIGILVYKAAALKFRLKTNTLPSDSDNDISKGYQYTER